MQTSMSLLVLGAVLLATSPSFAQRANSDAQARALEALREKMQELDGATPPSRPAPPPAAAQSTPPSVQPAPAVQPAPEVRPAPVQPVPAVQPPVTNMNPPMASPGVASTSTGEMDPRLRQALDRKMRELATTPTAETTPPATPPVAMPPVEPAPMTSPVVTEEASPKVEVTPTAQTPAPEVQPVTHVSPPPAMPPIYVGEGVAEALNPPPKAVSGSKEQRLHQLLNQYMANAISPEDYHKQRAAILAEP